MTTSDGEPHLPEQTTDDTDLGWGDEPPSGDDDVRRLLDERPPHHVDWDGEDRD